MRRKLFLTGPIGCGKSAAIRTGLGVALPKLGGFLTRRSLDGEGNMTGVVLASPDGSREETFLDFSSGQPRLDLQVFETLGTELLKDGVLLLDEIGGVELLCPAFEKRLEEVLRGDIPILGVLKGEEPAGKLIQRLGLSEDYARKAGQLRQFLEEDPDTQVLHCGRFDPMALERVRQWKEEYAHV